MIVLDENGDWQIAGLALIADAVADACVITDYEFGQPSGNSELLPQLPPITRQLDEPGAGLPAVPRFLAEHTAGPRTCASCLGATDREEYFAGDYYCDPCADKAHDYPWRTTHGGIAP